MVRFKWLFICLLICIILPVVSCTQEIPERETVVRNGLLYKMGEKHPFSGTVIGRGREDYRRKAYDFKKEYKNKINEYHAQQ